MINIKLNNSRFFPVVLFIISLLFLCNSPSNGKPPFVLENGAIDSSSISLSIRKYQPEIIKISNFGSDTFFLTKFYQNHEDHYNVFKYADKKFVKYSIDSFDVIDFSKFKNGAMFFTRKISASKYEIFSSDNHSVYQVNSYPILIDQSFAPAFIASDTLYIFDSPSNKFTKFWLNKDFQKSIQKEYKPTLETICKDRHGETAIFNNKLFITFDVGEFGGFVVEFDYLTGHSIYYEKVNVKTTLIAKDSLYFLAGCFHMGSRYGEIFNYSNGLNTRLLNNGYESIEDSAYSDSLNAFETMTYIPNEKNFLLCTYDGLALLDGNNFNKLKTKKYEFTLDFGEYSACNPPSSVIVFDTCIFVGMYRSALYIFDLRDFSLIEKVLFSKENLESIGFKW